MGMAGICWAGYELAAFLLLLDLSTPEERTSILTSFNVMNAIALVGGSLIGGFLLHSFGENQLAYTLLFVISGFARLAALPLLRSVRDHRPRIAVGTDETSSLKSISMEEDGSFIRPPESIP